MEIKRLPLGKVKQNTGQIKGLPSNPRQWTQTDIDRIAKSLQETPELFEARPLIVYEQGGDYIILGGNLRYEGAKKNKMKDVPVHILPEGLSIEKLKEIVIKDNGSFGDWDVDMLANEWDDLPLKDWGVDVAWDAVHLEEVAPQERAEVEEDDFDVENEHIETRCKRGDIWQLGDHRLMCGDSTSKEDVVRLMGGAKADMVFTDPPYGINYSGGRTQVVAKKTYGEIKNDNLQGKDLGNLICNVFDFNKIEADVYICVSPVVQKPFLDKISESGKEVNAVIVWDKKSAGLGYMAYRRQCEFILFVKGGAFHKGDASDVDLWRIGRDDTTTYVHGTQKPIGVAARAMGNSSKDGDIVLDYFGGSGSTMIAAEQLGRKAYLMELDEHYCDVIIARWEKHTGRQAEKIN